MKRKFLIPASLALAAALFGACKATDTPSSQTSTHTAPSAGTTGGSAESARRISPAELQAMLAEGGVVVYDTRPKGAYDAEHIKGALSMPSAEVDARAGELPKGKTLVFYCT
jgi:3-mercaptopyruvate sulfurtransferase SseA